VLLSLLVVLGLLNVFHLDVLPLSLFTVSQYPSCVWSYLHTPRLTASQIFSDEVSKALLSWSICWFRSPSAFHIGVQLHAESGGEDSAQHGVVSSEEGAAVGGQRCLGEGVARGEACL
jgi:hypothetical protein